MTSINLNTTIAPPPPHERSDRGARMDTAMQGVADLLRLTTDELKQARQDGKTLADLASEKGVSKDEVITALSKGLAENAPADAPSDVDFTQMATDMVNGVEGPRHHGGPPRGMERFAGSTENTADSTLTTLLDGYGIDGDALPSLLSGDTSAVSGTQTEEFVTQLRSLISQYGSKGLSYDVSA